MPRSEPAACYPLPSVRMDRRSMNIDSWGIYRTGRRLESRRSPVPNTHFSLRVPPQQAMPPVAVGTPYPDWIRRSPSCRWNCRTSPWQRSRSSGRNNTTGVRC
eukprot:ctg_3596.g574